MSHIQSIILERSHFSFAEALDFIERNGFKSSFYGKPVDITDHFYRFRQRKPQPNYRYITKDIKPGVRFIIYFKK